jgi:hypothetical protein
MRNPMQLANIFWHLNYYSKSTKSWWAGSGAHVPFRPNLIRSLQALRNSAQPSEEAGGRRKPKPASTSHCPCRHDPKPAADEGGNSGRPWRRRRPRLPSTTCRRTSRSRPTYSARSRKASTLSPPQNPRLFSAAESNPRPPLTCAASLRRHLQEPPGPQAVHHPGR